jgi:hypothetical protein
VTYKITGTRPNRIAKPISLGRGNISTVTYITKERITVIKGKKILWLSEKKRLFKRNFLFNLNKSENKLILTHRHTDISPLRLDLGILLYDLLDQMTKLGKKYTAAEL